MPDSRVNTFIIHVAFSKNQLPMKIVADDGSVVGVIVSAEDFQSSHGEMPGESIETVAELNSPEGARPIADDSVQYATP